VLKSVVLVSLFALTACGGGGGSTSPVGSGSAAGAASAGAAPVPAPAPASAQGPALTPQVIEAIAEVATKARPCASGASDCVVVAGVEQPVVTGTGLGIQPVAVTPPADAPAPSVLPPPVSTAVADQLGQPCASGATVCVSLGGVEQPVVPVPMCGPNLGGQMFPCDPRWPFPGVMPVYGATQDQVDGFNHDCQTMNCIQVRCPDGRIVPFSLRAGCEVALPAKEPATEPVTPATPVTPVTPAVPAMQVT
jgi:hypothetical protein